MAEKTSFRVKMAVLSAVLISESLSATLVMPFVGLFVAHLQHISPNDAGYMSGVLVSVFQLGQMLTGKLWGSASDRVGRKPMIQIGLVANALTATLFGMSPNIKFCVLMRFVHGCANGNVLVAKTVIADITDKTTEGVGFAAISVFWGVGSVIGPALGGLLYNPSASVYMRDWLPHDDLTSNVLVVHPAFLPCFVITLFSLLTLAVISVALPETSQLPVSSLLSLFARAPRLEVAEETLAPMVAAGELAEAEDEANHDESSTSSASSFSSGLRENHLLRPAPTSSRDAGADDGAGIKQSPTALAPCRPRPAPCDTEGPRTRHLASRKSFLSQEEPPATSSVDLSVVVAEPASDVVHFSSFGYREALRLPSARYVLIMYMCIASTECALLEVIPLWAIASPSKGGLALTSTDVGWLLGISSVVCVLANVVFGRVVRWARSTRAVWDFSMIFWAVTSILTPCAVFVTTRYTFSFVACITSLREIGLSWAYSLIYMYVVRAAPRQFVGAMNGVAQSLASSSRMITMLIIPPTFAWSLSGVHHPFPFNYNFAFWITCVPLLIGYLLSSYVPLTVTEA